MWNGMPRAAAREQTWKSEQMKLVFTRQMAMNEALQVLFTAGHELGVQPWQPLHTLTPLSRHHTKYGIWICVTALCTLQNAAICFQAKLQNRCCHLCGDRSCFSCGRSKAFKSIELSFENARLCPHLNCCVHNSYATLFLMRAGFLAGASRLALTVLQHHPTLTGKG